MLREAGPRLEEWARVIVSLLHLSTAITIRKRGPARARVNAQSLLLLNSLKSKRLARFSVRRVGHTQKCFAGYDSN
jgi:hypothetical protein